MFKKSVQRGLIKAILRKTYNMSYVYPKGKSLVYNLNYSEIGSSAFPFRLLFSHQFYVKISQE